MLATLSAFTVQARAQVNEGDWNYTNHAQWWWKYVYPGGIHPNWTLATVAQVQVGQDIIDAKTGDAMNAVLFTAMNSTKSYVKCDGSVTLLHTIRAADGSVLYSQAIGKGAIGTLAPGQSFQVRGTAFSSAKFRGFNHYIEVQVQ
jgi:hypothetical protein